jgi:hypothetical protein
MSGNNLGETLWSDLKSVYPMLPEYPSLIRCSGCNNFIWIKDAKLVDLIIYNDDKYTDIGFTKHPGFFDYNDMLNSDFVSDEKERFYIMQRLMWAYNDFIRNNEAETITAEMINIFESNLPALFEMIDAGKPDGIFLKAEILRELKIFDGCIRFLEQNKLQGDIEDFAEIIRKKAEEGDYRVTMLW